MLLTKRLGLIWMIVIIKYVISREFPMDIKYPGGYLPILMIMPMEMVNSM